MATRQLMTTTTNNLNTNNTTGTNDNSTAKVNSAGTGVVKNWQSSTSKADQTGNVYQSGYSSNYADELNDLYSQILNRGNFSYDLNGDMLYQNYKDQYIQNAKQANLDAQGTAASLTGGYGSSYGAMAGNQAYQQYLTQLNDVIPDLYDRAEDTWNTGTSNLYNQYNTTYEADNNDYTRYQNSVTNAYNTVMQLIQTGVMPSDDMLAVAGISKADAKAYVNKYLADQAYDRWVQQGMPGADTGSSGGGGGGSTKTYNYVKDASGNTYNATSLSDVQNAAASGNYSSVVSMLNNASGNRALITSTDKNLAGKK